MTFPICHNTLYYDKLDTNITFPSSVFHSIIQFLNTLPNILYCYLNFSYDDINWRTHAYYISWTRIHVTAIYHTYTLSQRRTIFQEEKAKTKLIPQSHTSRVIRLIFHASVREIRNTWLLSLPSMTLVMEPWGISYNKLLFLSSAYLEYEAFSTS